MESKKYQIFLSSTYADLVDERESIIKAILEMYHIPIGMEMFSAEDEDQWEIIRRTIEVSDYYILVLGLRYGSKTSEGISFTQKEYEYALERKIPILAFIMKDTVALPKVKRDDNLQEINAFRETVLSNSKMAQFWETKDELIKNVSVSLMKQIMQKPGVGWIRGDQAGLNDTLSKELSVLSKENRELREKITLLESKVLVKLPIIDVKIAPPKINDNYHFSNDIEMPYALDYSQIESHLHEFITEDDIIKYNNKLPSEKELEVYNNERNKLYKIKNYSTPLNIEVSNIGSAKANNIYIDIKFPDGILIYENNKEFTEPRSPIPFNPLTKAKMEYNKKIEAQNISVTRFNSRIADNIGLGLASALGSNSFLKNIRPINATYWTKLEGNKLTIKINDLLHTRFRTFNDEYMIVPL
ncbi:DUF4062 domain-containing protein, partial [Salmonella enterica]|nr:DUF4062 domain-containing protein [Salmonella enterica]